MAETADVKRAREVLGAEIEFLKTHASMSVSPCDVAKLIAVTDERVLQVLMEHVARGDQPRGVTCIGLGRVLFAFGCPPNTICLVPRDVLVVVDLERKRVIEVVDPYDTQGRSDRSSERLNKAGVIRIPSVRTHGVREHGFGRGIRSAAKVAVSDAPQLNAMEMVFDAADALSITFTVPEMARREVIDDDGNVFLFDGTSLVLTVPSAGTYRLTLHVSDATRPNQSFTYTIAPGATPTNLQATLDGSGNVFVTHDVDVK